MIQEDENACLICFSPGRKLISVCDCLFCEECMLKWITTNIRSGSYEIDSSFIRCPNHVCNKAGKINEFTKSLSRESENLIEKELLNIYLRNTDDIRNCPTATCDYYGIIIKKACDQPLVCEACGKEWWDKENFTRKRKLIQGVKQMFILENEIFSVLYQELFAKACPGCEIMIIRNGGCQHITCKKCTYEFCWYCKQDYHSHQVNVCIAHVVAKIIIFGIIIFNLLYKLGIISKICNILYVLLFWFVKYIILMNLFFLFVFLSLYTAYTSITSRANRSTCQNYAVGFLYLCTFIYSGLLFYYGYMKEAAYFFCSEIIFIVLTLPVYYTYDVVVYSWMQHVS